MKYLRQMWGRFGKAQVPKSPPKKVILDELLAKARRAQYAEAFDEALTLLQEAMPIAEAEHDIRAKVDITLSRADIMMVLDNFETAEFILTELRDDTKAREMQAPYAYSLCSLGVLEQKRANLDGAQALFEEARAVATAINTDGASGRAAAHLADISLRQGNASYAVYLLEDAVQKLDNSGDRELLAYFLGQLGLASIDSGQSQQGEIYLRRGLEMASNFKQVEQRRALNTLLGEHALNNDDYAKAKTYFDAALGFYSEPIRDPINHATLLAQLAQAHLNLGNQSEANDYAKQAYDLAQTLADDVLSVFSKATLGMVLRPSDSEKALDYLRDADDAYADDNNKRFYLIILRNLAAVTIESGDTEKGVQTYQQAIEKAQDLPAMRATLHSDLAEHFATHNQLRDAISNWQMALSHYQDLNDNDAIARVYCDLAASQNRLGEGRMAQRDYGNALEQLSLVNDVSTRGIILANVAAAYSEFGDIDSAKDFFKESIEIAQRTRNRGAEARRRGNYGRLLTLTNHPKEALTQLMQAQRISKELQLNIQTQVIEGNIGLAYAALGDTDTAIECYQSAQQALANLDAAQWAARVYADWADVLVMIDNLSEAEAHYQTALKLAKQEELVDVLIQAVIGQARIALAQDDFDTAENKLDTLLPIAKRQNYRRLLANLYQVQSQVYAKQSKPEQARTAWDESKTHRSIMRMKPIAPDWL